jgi:hypothetical protein
MDCRSTFEACLDGERNFRRIAATALVPAAVAALVLLFHKLFEPFALVTLLYILWMVIKFLR